MTLLLIFRLDDAENLVSGRSAPGLAFTRFFCLQTAEIDDAEKLVAEEGFLGCEGRLCQLRVADLAKLLAAASR